MNDHEVKQLFVPNGTDRSPMRLMPLAELVNLLKPFHIK